jgi:carboxyl-terminal processing protease
MDVAEGDLDYAMAFDQVPPARFTKLNMAGPEVVAKLTENSVKRRNDSTDFQRLERDIQRYVDQKQRKTVTLNKAAYLAEREEFNAEKQDEDTVNKQVEGPSSEIQRDFYLDEVLQIAADYSQMMKKS